MLGREWPRTFRWILLVIWTVVIAVSLVWNIYQIDSNIKESAKIQARSSFQRDVTYRKWNAAHGGVYATISENSGPNPYLKVEERDITTPSGKKLTLINPAFMTRQVFELAEEKFGYIGHITSLKPIRPENSPDQWEVDALTSFESGSDEISSPEVINSAEYLRLMKPLVTEKSCLKCHAAQGYKVGDVRGGISVAVPLKPLEMIANRHLTIISIGHFSFWILGVMGIFVFAGVLLRSERKRSKIAREKENLIDELKEAITQVKTLKGLIPICASCKKIRDDKGFWNNVEEYISDKTEAEFSHGICPDCMKSIYGDFTND